MVPKVAVTIAWVSPRVNTAEPCVRGRMPVCTVIGRTVSVARPSMRGSPSMTRRRTIDFSSFENAPLISSRSVTVADRFDGLVLGRRHRVLALLLVGDLVGRRQVGPDGLLDLSRQTLIGSSAACQFQLSVPTSAASSLIALTAVCRCS